MIHTVQVDGPWGTCKVECGADELLLDALIRQSASPAYCCRAGLCGMCKVTVTKGTVRRLPSNARALSSEDIDRGHALTCCAKPLSDCTLRPIIVLQQDGAGGRRPVLATVISLDEEPSLTLLRINAGTAGSPAYSLGEWAWLRPLDVDLGARLACFVETAEDTWVFALAPAQGPSLASSIAGDRILLDGPIGTAIDRGIFEHPVAIVLDESGLPLLRALSRLRPCGSAPLARLLVLVGAVPVELADSDAVAARRLVTPDLGEIAPSWRQELAALAKTVAADGHRLRVIVRGADRFQARVRRLLTGTGIRAWDVGAENLLDLGRNRELCKRKSE